MRKINFFLIALLATLTLATSCTKDKHEDRNDPPDTPKTTLPDAFVGKWMIGNFDMSQFVSYTGERQPDATDMVAYTIKKDGSAEQFIYYNYDDGSDKQVLTYRKGTMTFDEATATLKFCPSEGRYRLFENGAKTDDAMDASGLYPSYAPRYRNCSIETQDNVQYLVGTSDQDQTLGFAKTAW